MIKPSLWDGSVIEQGIDDSHGLDVRTIIIIYEQAMTVEW